MKSKDYSEQIRGEFNQWRFDEWKAVKSEEGNSIYESLRLSNYKNSNAYKYHQYLNSDEWKARRLLVLDRDNNLCQSCKNEKAEDIHHLSYENLYNEPLDDLQALCRECHINLHRKEFLDKHIKN
ncbi:5-methylcytosine-specific restriction endonuclease McrA [Pedobacter cryoconitis]|uniref:5-methylcytosine-specific restriction endonuclease McrA n=1 Tax=Pedobacter cryoconitis TaxID=188932 RepID=A0A7W9DLW1_9SPHI|nr:hypothetical protein [Pedobacter cryoconitis]MBB5623736.1 5-methylcytosine-specific restriction endonuclease McrA [Pedobacter cryoconitis]